MPAESQIFFLIFAHRLTHRTKWLNTTSSNAAKYPAGAAGVAKEADLPRPPQLELQMVLQCRPSLKEQFVATGLERDGTNVRKNPRIQIDR